MRDKTRLDGMSQGEDYEVHWNSLARIAFIAKFIGN